MSKGYENLTKEELLKELFKSKNQITQQENQLLEKENQLIQKESQLIQKESQLIEKTYPHYQLGLVPPFEYSDFCIHEMESKVHQGRGSTSYRDV